MVVVVSGDQRGGLTQWHRGEKLAAPGLVPAKAHHLEVSSSLISFLPASGIVTARPDFFESVYLPGTAYSKRTGSPPSRLPLGPVSMTWMVLLTCTLYSPGMAPSFSG